MRKILNVLVGSRAHGLHNPDSDYDYRGVFVIPTSDFFSVDVDPKKTNWQEGSEKDDTSWELQHFLKLSTKGNPTILETYLAPVEHADELGLELKAIFPYVWSSDDVARSFIGYGLNQRTKFFDNKDNLASKYAEAFLRVLYNGHELLTTGTFSVDFSKTPIFDTLKRFRAGEYEVGEVIQTCYEWQTKVELAHKQMKKKETDMNKVNEFLLKVRKENW